MNLGSSTFIFTKESKYYEKKCPVIIRKTSNERRSEQSSQTGRQYQSFGKNLQQTVGSEGQNYTDLKEINSFRGKMQRKVFVV